MAEECGPLIDVLLQRTRDPQGTANTRLFVRTILSMAQQLTNAGIKAIIDELPLVTEPMRQVYPIKDLLPVSANIVAVREEGRDLKEVDWRTLAQVDRQWPRRTGSRFETYSLVGRDLLIVHPALPETSHVDVHYAILTAELTSESTRTELHDDFVPVVLDLAETVLLMRGRQFDQANAALLRIALRFGLNV